MAYLKLQKPHSTAQKTLILSDSRDVCFAGRRWGKTHAGTQRLLRGAVESPGVYWWIGLSWKAASMNVAWRQLLRYHTQVCNAFQLVPKEHRSMQKYELYFPNESVIQMRTAENPESLAGESVNGMIFDEFTMARESVWNEQLAPTLISTAGWALMIGVPKSNNWATKLWRQAKNRRGWNQHHFTTYDNPLLKKQDIEDIRETMTESMARQELDAEIIEGKGSVFRHITERTGAKWTDKALPGRFYVAGVDWARKNDWTVVTVMDITSREVVYYERFNDVNYATQMEYIKRIHQDFKLQRIIAEENAMGGPLIEQLSRDGLPVEPFVTGALSKRTVIEDLAIAFDTGTISIPLDETLIDELQAFEMEIGANGVPKYAAPKGMHDDICMSLALCYHAFAYSHRL